MKPSTPPEAGQAPDLASIETRWLREYMLRFAACATQEQLDAVQATAWATIKWKRGNAARLRRSERSASERVARLLAGVSLATRRQLSRKAVA